MGSPLAVGNHAHDARVALIFGSERILVGLPPLAGTVQKELLFVKTGLEEAGIFWRLGARLKSTVFPSGEKRGQ